MIGTRKALALALAAGLAVAATACGGGDSGSASGGKDDGKFTIGFIYVGPKDDFGYNQAAYAGSREVAKALPDATILEAENVPETSEAETVMEQMVDKGADLIYATSFGHLEFAEKVAERHPDVVVVHQGGLEKKPGLANFGTYFGTVYEPVYTAGVAAGAASKSGKLGYVYAFPIPQTLANINAFTLGAQSVNPKAKTITVATGSWCDPSAQAQAAKSLLDQGVDVITQHQDCTKTIIEKAEQAGAYTVGYHADAENLAPKGWLTGSQWNWGPLYTDIAKTVEAGKFEGSKYDGDFRVGLQTGDNPFVQSPFGPAVTASTKETIAADKQRFVDGGSPFAGPVKDQDGKTVWKQGEQPTYDQVETMDFFVQGVVGKVE
jgi:simple sugar transport system substrate-binding protein/basic membrane protein A